MERSCQTLYQARETPTRRGKQLHLDAVYSNKENITFDLDFYLNSQDEMRTVARRKNLLILILHYLMEEGYVDAANALEQETKLSLRGFEVCDNIDLEMILMEYESYYFVKFQKYPKITKKVLDTAENKQQLRTGGRPRRAARSS
ncbi:katanin p60 ATPase-containing subunit A-like 2 isoform X2 [Mycteria americana]|uniref:katanin p60 ATPase-containing subunit A-like 2 isoform X2 n=1 Tax=Mycteria americana TaxID=33587 RepID=UPI003F586D45